MKENYWAIVPAAGIGKRMGSDVPKQYLDLQGKPILQHTLERLAKSPVSQILVCIADNDTYWEKLPVPDKVQRAVGGKERCHSVFNGLKVLENYADAEDWVLVHDAVRPCIRPSDIDKLMIILINHSVGGLLALPVRDTMKRGNEEGMIVKTVNRENLWHALTPQMFRFHILYEALQRVLDANEMVTDEAQAVEKLGYFPILVEGHADNIKITHPQDLILAGLFLERQQHIAAIKNYKAE